MSLIKVENRKDFDGLTKRIAIFTFFVFPQQPLLMKCKILTEKRLLHSLNKIILYPARSRSGLRSGVFDPDQSTYLEH